MSTEYQAELFVPDVPLFVPKATSRIIATYTLRTGQCYPVRRLLGQFLWHWPVCGRATYINLKPTTK